MLFSPSPPPPFNLGKGGKNRRRGKNENESEKRELVFKEDGQGEFLTIVWQYHCFQSDTVRDVRWKLIHKDDIWMSEKYKVIVE